MNTSLEIYIEFQSFDSLAYRSLPGEIPSSFSISLRFWAAFIKELLAFLSISTAAIGLLS